MSLEEALRENTEALKENSALSREIIGFAAKNKGAAATKADAEEAGEKPARKPRATKDPDDKPKGPTKEDVSNLVTSWLGEIDVEVDEDGNLVDDSEENQKLLKKRTNRKNFVKKCLTKAGVERVSELTESKDIANVFNWITTKKGGADPFEDEDT